MCLGYQQNNHYFFNSAHSVSNYILHVNTCKKTFFFADRQNGGGAIFRREMARWESFSCWLLFSSNMQIMVAFPYSPSQTCIYFCKHMSETLQVENQLEEEHVFFKKKKKDKVFTRAGKMRLLISPNARIFNVLIMGRKKKTLNEIYPASYSLVELGRPNTPIFLKQ